MAYSEDKTTIIEIPLTEETSVTDETPAQEAAPAEPAAAEAEPTATPEAETSKPDPLQECEDRFKRLAADFANYKRRSEAERNELMDLLEARLLNGVLAIHDDFCRLSRHTEGASEQLAQGIKAVQTKWQTWLVNEGVEMISPLDQAFDPHVHDALMQQPVQEAEKDGQVLHVIECGYKRRDKVLRHAKVIVGHFEAEEQAPESYEEPQTEETGEEHKEAATEA